MEGAPPGLAAGKAVAVALPPKPEVHSAGVTLPAAVGFADTGMTSLEVSAMFVHSPDDTLPKTTCLPSSQLVLAVVIKN